MTCLQTLAIYSPSSRERCGFLLQSTQFKRYITPFTVSLLLDVSCFCVSNCGQPGQSASGQNNCKEVFIAVLQTFFNQFHLVTDRKVQHQNPVGEYIFIPNDWWLSRRHWLVSRLLWLGPNIYALHTKDYQFQTRRRHKPSLTSQSYSIAGPKFR